MAIIETEFISSIGATPPKIVHHDPSNGTHYQASCGKCGTRLWDSGSRSPVTADIFTGTLDLPEIMEPDLHAFIEGKISWVILPEGTKTCKGQFDYREHWPKSSLARLDAAVQRATARQEAKQAASKAQDAEEEKEADKTPTAQTPDEKDETVEDDEEFERRYRETEQALQQRLELLSLRLNENEKVQGDDLRSDVVGTAEEPPAARQSNVSTTSASES